MTLHRPKASDESSREQPSAVSKGKYLYGDGSLPTVCLQVDLQLWQGLPLRHQPVPQLLQRVAAVGDQLPDKHLGMTTHRLTLQPDPAAWPCPCTAFPQSCKLTASQ